jgi:predicted peroxiredoxin
MLERSLVVKCTTVDPEPCAQAFTVAATALAAGAKVSVWLTGDASHLARPGVAEGITLPHSAPLSELRDAVIEDGTLTVCTQCAARRDLTQADLLPHVRIAGAATFVDEILSAGAQALVYGAGTTPDA